MGGLRVLQQLFLAVDIFCIIFGHKPFNILYITDRKDKTDGSGNSTDGKGTDGKGTDGKGTDREDPDGTNEENKPRTTINPKFGTLSFLQTLSQKR